MSGIFREDVLASARDKAIPEWEKQGKRSAYEDHRAILTNEEVSALYTSGERNFAGANLFRIDLHGKDLKGIDLSGAYLYGAYLPGAVLNGANLSGAIFYGANLLGVELDKLVQVDRETDFSFVICDHPLFEKLVKHSKPNTKDALGRRDWVIANLLAIPVAQ